MEKALAAFSPYAYAILRIMPGYCSFLTVGKNSLAGSAANRFRSGVTP